MAFLPHPRTPGRDRRFRAGDQSSETTTGPPERTSVEAVPSTLGQGPLPPLAVAAARLGVEPGRQDATERLRPGLLGQVHRPVRQLQDLGEREACAARPGTRGTEPSRPSTCAAPSGRPPEVEGLGADRRHDAAREDVAARAVRVARDEQELLAAPADQPVRVAHDLRQPAGDLREHAVAAVVAVLVVDVLEVVDVDDVEDEVAVARPALRRRRVHAQRPIDVVLDDRREEPPVARPGQRVGERRLAQLPVGRGELGAARGDGLLQAAALGLEVPGAPPTTTAMTAAAASSTQNAAPTRVSHHGAQDPSRTVAGRRGDLSRRGDAENLERVRRRVGSAGKRASVSSVSVNWSTRPTIRCR